MALAGRGFKCLAHLLEVSGCLIVSASLLCGASNLLRRLKLISKPYPKGRCSGVAARA